MTSELIAIAKLLTPTEALVLQQALEAEGIRSYQSGAEVDVVFGQVKGLGGVRLMVAAADLKRAETVVARAEAEAAAEESSSDSSAWTCPACGAAVTGDFDTCWSCGTSRDGEPDPTFKKADE